MGLQGDDDDDGSVNPRGVGVVLGEDVVLEPACWVQGNVGRGSCVEAGAKVGRGAVVGEVSVLLYLLLDVSMIFGG